MKAEGGRMKDDLKAFLYATLGDASASFAGLAVKLFFSLASSASSAVKL